MCSVCDHERRPSHDVDASRRSERGGTGRDGITVEFAAEEQLTGGDGGGEVVDLVPAVERDVDVFVFADDSLDARLPAADGNDRIDRLEVGAEAVPRRAGLRDAGGECPLGSRRQDPGHENPIIFEDRRLLPGDLPDRGPEVRLVVERHSGDDRHLGVHDVGGIQPPAESHLDDGDVDTRRGARLKGDRGGHLEVGDVRALRFLVQLDERSNVGDGGNEAITVELGSGYVETLLEILQVG